MAASAYRQVDDFTCGLTACTLGSAPGQTLSNEYRRTLPCTFMYLAYERDVGLYVKLDCDHTVQQKNGYRHMTG